MKLLSGEVRELVDCLFEGGFASRKPSIVRIDVAIVLRKNVEAAHVFVLVGVRGTITSNELAEGAVLLHVLLGHRRDGDA